MDLALAVRFAIGRKHAVFAMDRSERQQFIEAYFRLRRKLHPVLIYRDRQRKFPGFHRIYDHRTAWAYYSQEKPKACGKCLITDWKQAQGSSAVFFDGLFNKNQTKRIPGRYRYGFLGVQYTADFLFNAYASISRNTNYRKETTRFCVKTEAGWPIYLKNESEFLSHINEILWPNLTENDLDRLMFKATAQYAAWAEKRDRDHPLSTTLRHVASPRSEG